MSLELSPAAPAAKNRLRRADGAGAAVAVPGLDPKTWAMPALAVMAAGFVLLGAGNLDVGPADARVGLAANEPFSALGLVFGSLGPGPLAGARGGEFPREPGLKQVDVLRRPRFCGRPRWLPWRSAGSWHGG